MPSWIFPIRWNAHHIEHDVLRMRLAREEAERTQEGDRVEDAGVDDDEKDRPDVTATCARTIDAAFDGPEPECEESYDGTISRDSDVSQWAYLSLRSCRTKLSRRRQ